MHVVSSEMGRSNFHFHPKTQEKKPALEGRTGNIAKLTEGLWEAVGRKLWFQCFVGRELQCCWGIFLQWLLRACRAQYKRPGGLEQEKVQFVGLRKDGERPRVQGEWGTTPKHGSNCSWEAEGGRGGQHGLVYAEKSTVSPRQLLNTKLGLSWSVRTGLRTCRLCQCWRGSACLPPRPQGYG